jgi:hypothetical protein
MDWWPEKLARFVPARPAVGGTSAGAHTTSPFTLRLTAVLTVTFLVAGMVVEASTGPLPDRYQRRAATRSGE